jgi:hypothetical protein
MSERATSDRAQRAKRRMSIFTTALITLGVIGLAALAVVMHT